MIKGSDHRPVFGRFVVNILKETRKGSQSVIIEESYVDNSEYDENENVIENEIEIEEISMHHS